MKFLFRKFTAAVVMLSIAICGCGCHKQNNSSNVIYTSFYGVYDLVRTIAAGSSFKVECLVPSGVEPHDWEPSTKSMVAVSNAKAFIYSGNGMEDWADNVIQNIPDVPNLCLSEAKGLTLNKQDPHFWLNIDNTVIESKSICAFLSSIDNRNAALYKSNLDVFVEKANRLKLEYTKAISSFGCKKLVVTHGAFSYLCQEFGLEQIVADSNSGEGDPSLKKLTEIISQIKWQSIPAVFYIEGESDKVANAISKEDGVNVKVYALNPFEFDSKGRNYLTVMSANLEVLRKAFE